MELCPTIEKAKTDKASRLAELSDLSEYVARYGAPFSCPVSRWEISGGSSVEQLSRAYPALTEEDIQRVLDETPPPDRIGPPAEVVPIEVAPGRRRKDHGPLLGRQGRGAETDEQAGHAVGSLGYRRRLQRLPKRSIHVTPVL